MQFQTALELWRKKKGSDDAKLSRILAIWGSDGGVLSLHLFQNSLAVGALSREAAMLDALGLHALSNKQRGSYYGPPATWSVSKSSPAPRAQPGPPPPETCRAPYKITRGTLMIFWFVLTRFSRNQILASPLSCALRVKQRQSNPSARTEERRRAYGVVLLRRAFRQLLIHPPSPLLPQNVPASSSTRRRRKTKPTAAKQPRFPQLRPFATGLMVGLLICLPCVLHVK